MKLGESENLDNNISKLYILGIYRRKLDCNCFGNQKRK